MSDPAPIRLLIVDDQQSIRQLCSAIGERLGLSCTQAESALAALEQMERTPAELMLADMEMGGRSGLDLLAEVKRRSPLTEVSLMGSYGSPELRCASLKFCCACSGSPGSAIVSSRGPSSRVIGVRNS